MNVHDLIAQQVAHLDPAGIDRWGVLLERLALVVGDGAEEHNLVLVLSLRVVVTSVDRAVLAGAPFTIGYLTLLGNMAVVLAAAGHYEEAIQRLQAEVHLAETQAAQLPSAHSRPVAWFGLLAALQLAAVRIRRDEPGEALSLLEEALPRIEGFQGLVGPAKLSSALEMTVDVLEAIRLPELVTRRDALLEKARGGHIEESTSPLREVEMLLRQDELSRAREVCRNALDRRPRLVEEIDLYGKLAETWATEDVPKSDELLRLAHMKAQAEEIDPEQPFDDLQNTIQRRIRHLVSLDSEALHRDLPTYRTWFLADSLMPREEECRSWRQLTMARFSRAWRHLTEPALDASRAVAVLSGSFDDAPQSISPGELIGLRSLLWGTQFVGACSTLDHLEQITDIGRKGSTILIQASPSMWARIPELLVDAALSRRTLVVGHRFGPLVLIQVGNWGLFMEAIANDPFSTAGGETTICLVRPGELVSAARPVREDHILELGTIPSLHAEEDYASLAREHGAS